MGSHGQSLGDGDGRVDIERTELNGNNCLLVWLLWRKARRMCHSSRDCLSLDLVVVVVPHPRPVADMVSLHVIVIVIVIGVVCLFAMMIWKDMMWNVLMLKNLDGWECLGIRVDFVW